MQTDVVNNFTNNVFGEKHQSGAVISTAGLAFLTLARLLLRFRAIGLGRAQLMNLLKINTGGALYNFLDVKNSPFE